MRFAARPELAFLDRRTFLRLAGYGGAGLVAMRPAFSFASAGALDPASVSQMEFDVTYRTEVRSLPRDAMEVHVWMPLPPSNSAQEIRDLSVSCPLPYESKVEPLFGNRMVHVRSGPEPEPFSIEARYHVVRRRVGAMPAALDAESAAKYLRLTPRVRITDDVEALTKKAVGGATRPIDVGRRVYDAIIDHLSYDK